MATLEAMARGQCIVANDDATANEYIIDGVNGHLFDAREPKELVLNPAHAEKYGRAARKTVEIGHEKFSRGIDDLLWFIASTPRPNPSYAANYPAKKFIRAAYYMFTNVYATLGMLADAEKAGAFVDRERFFYGLQTLKARARHLPFLNLAVWRMAPRLGKFYRRQMRRTGTGRDA